MRIDDFTSTVSDGKTIYVHRWLPDANPRGILLIAHGMAEHGRRYASFAGALAARGWIVCAPDHRGHGLTAAENERGWLAERDGFRRIIDDVEEIARDMLHAHGHLPLTLYGHCMGSLIGLAFAGLHGSMLSACVLTGIISEPSASQLAIGKLLSAMGCLFNGQLKSAPMLDYLILGRHNREFEPARTAYEWLSRDRDQVDTYAADPLCGFVCSYGFFCDVFSAFDLIYGPSGVLRRIPASLPMHLAAGSADPIGGAHGAVGHLAAKLRGNGVLHVDESLYAGARHELLNETNRDEVISDFCDWLERVSDQGVSDQRVSDGRVRTVRTGGSGHEH